jgi:hypothetical protein
MGEQPVILISRVSVDVLLTKISRVNAIRRWDCAANSRVCLLYGCPAITARSVAEQSFATHVQLEAPFPHSRAVHFNAHRCQLRAQFGVREVAILLKAGAHEVLVSSKLVDPRWIWLERTRLSVFFQHLPHESP